MARELQALKEYYQRTLVDDEGNALPEDEASEAHSKVS